MCNSTKNKNVNLKTIRVIVCLKNNYSIHEKGFILEQDFDKICNMKIKLDSGRIVEAADCIFIKKLENEVDNNETELKMSNQLKKRFCKDCNIPLNVLIEPYFSDRLKLYDNQFDTLNKFKLFKKSLESYESEDDYFKDYNKFKDSVIMDIKGSQGYKRFIEEDFNKYAVDNKKISTKDIYKDYNVGKTLMSIDMVKANFTSMKHYDETIFKGKETYEEYLSLFTDNKHFINSKYIRQVIFGNNNPRRQTTYEKYLMNLVLEDILKLLNISKIISFTNDEIVLDITDVDKKTIVDIKQAIINSSINIGIKLKIKEFVLNKLEDNIGYVKEFSSKKYKFQCVDGLMLPFVLRKYNKESVIDSDKVFVHQGKLAKLMEIPKI